MSVERIKRQGGEVVWRVRWREGGRNRSQVLGSKRDAQDFDAEVRRRKRAGTLAQIDAGTETLDEYVTGSWWPSHTAHLAPKTRRDYAHFYDRHVSRPLGGYQLRELTPETIARWQTDKLAGGTGPVAVKKSLTLLGNILERAIDAGRIPSNPQRRMRKARLPSRPETRPLAPDAVERMRSASNHRDATLIAVLAYAGVRPCEARALRWGQVRERTILVNASSKTGQTRTVRLLAPLATDLAEWRLACGRPWDDAPVFPGQAGRPWPAEGFNKWRARGFRDALDAAGIQRARPYDLRHSFASLLLHEGRSVIYVARQLGHGADQTMNTYGHVIEEFEDAPRLAAESAIREARAALVPVSYLVDGGR